MRGFSNENVAQQQIKQKQQYYCQIKVMQTFNIGDKVLFFHAKKEGCSHIGHKAFLPLSLWIKVYDNYKSCSFTIPENTSNPVGKLGQWLMTLNSYNLDIIN